MDTTEFPFPVSLFLKHFWLLAIGISCINAFLMVGAAILVLDEQNRLLLMKRSDSGCWGIPGGSIEPGETVEVAAKRETFEETNLEIGEMALFGAFSGPELYYKYPNGDEVYNVTIVYLSRDWHGEVTLNDEHTEWR